MSQQVRVQTIKCFQQHWSIAPVLSLDAIAAGNVASMLDIFSVLPLITQLQPLRLMKCTIDLAFTLVSPVINDNVM